MRRKPEGLLERPAKVIPAELDQLRERGERDLLADVLLDIGGDGPLLPGREAAPRGRFDPLRPGVEARELVRQDDAKRLEIELVRAGTLHQRRELERRVPQRRIFEEQAWRKQTVHRIAIRMLRRPAGSR